MDGFADTSTVTTWQAVGGGSSGYRARHSSQAIDPIDGRTAGQPWRAIDGTAGITWWSNSCSHTDKHPTQAQWWAMDLGTAQLLYAVKVFMEWGKYCRLGHMSC